MRISDLKIATRLKSGFGVIVAALVVLVVIAYSNFSKLGHFNNLNVHTYQVLNEVSAILESLINIETGERGFALTGAEASLAPYTEGKETFKKHLGSAKSLTSDNPAQQARLDKLTHLQQEWMDVGIDSVIKLRREAADGNMTTVVTAEQAGKGKRIMDAMRVLLADLAGAEDVLLVQRSKDATAMQSLTGSMLIGGGVIVALIAALIAVWLSRSITLPLLRAITVAKRIAHGDLTGV